MSNTTTRRQKIEDADQETEVKPTRRVVSDEDAPVERRKRAVVDEEANDDEIPPRKGQSKRKTEEPSDDEEESDEALTPLTKSGGKGMTKSSGIGDFIRPSSGKKTATKNVDDLEQLAWRLQESTDIISKSSMADFKSYITRKGNSDFRDAVDVVIRGMEEFSLKPYGKDVIIVFNSMFLKLLFKSGLSLGKIYEKDGDNVRKTSRDLTVDDFDECIDIDSDNKNILFMTKGSVATLAGIILANNGGFRKEKVGKSQRDTIFYTFNVEFTNSKHLLSRLAGQMEKGKSNTDPYNLSKITVAAMTKILTNKATTHSFDVDSYFKKNPKAFANTRVKTGVLADLLSLCRGGDAAITKQKESKEKKSSSSSKPALEVSSDDEDFGRKKNAKDDSVVERRGKRTEENGDDDDGPVERKRKDDSVVERRGKRTEENGDDDAPVGRRGKRNVDEETTEDPVESRRESRRRQQAEEENGDEE